MKRLDMLFFYEITRDANKASHTYKFEGRMVWDNELQMNGVETVKIPTNQSLESQIETVVNQAKENYDNRK